MTSASPRRTVLVTGASAGIGLAFARVFAEHGFDLVLTARREDRLDRVAGELTARHQVAARVLADDLEDPAAPARIVARLAADGVPIDALVNNAGYGLPGKYADTSWDAQARFIQIMVTACAELAHRLLPGMIERQYGRIINVSSVAGLVPGTPGHTLYAASKAFLVRFSQSLALETRRHGVHVTALCPGFTYTEFHDVNNTRPIVAQRVPRVMWLNADDVARQGFAGVMAGRLQVVPGFGYKALVALTRLLPESLVIKATLRQSRRFRAQ